MKNIIAELEALISENSLKFKTFSEVELAQKPQANKWSKKEIIGHLIDSAQNNIRRFVVGQYDTNPKIVYQQDNWVQSQAYQNYNSENLIQLWTLLNQHICLILSNIPIENYERTCDTGKEGIELHTLKYLAEDYVAHLKHHLVQIYK